MAKPLLTTPRQKSYAMQLWRKIRALHPELEESDRRSLILEITQGRADSLVHMRRVGEFTHFIARLKLLLDPADLHSQVRALQMPQINAAAAIEIERRKLAALLGSADGVDHASTYLSTLLVDRFGTRSLDSLTVQDLTRLRITLHARVTALAAKAGLSGHDLATIANVRCDCALCVRLPARPVRPRRQPQPAHAA